MAKLRVHNFSMSADGYAAGRAQTLDLPMGVHGERLHSWMFETAGGRAMLGQTGGTTGVDDDFFHAGETGIGATVMGRNMFGPIRGAWGDSDWRGWWGDDPVYHHPVFVLTHHPHEPIEMAGGTTFHFVTDGVDAAVEQAFAAAGGLDVRLGGGTSTMQQCLRARLVDELHIVVSPVVLGGGERVFGDDIDMEALGYEVVEHSTTAVLHVRVARRAG